MGWSAANGPSGHQLLEIQSTKHASGRAIALIRGADGVASWAHPNADCSRDTLLDLKRLGLGAVESQYPAFSQTRAKELRGWANELGLAISGGSDCHGPDQPRRAIGVSSITPVISRITRRTAESSTAYALKMA